METMIFIQVRAPELSGTIWDLPRLISDIDICQLVLATPPISEDCSRIRHDIDIRDKPRQTQYGACGGRQKGSSAISDLDEFVLEEEDYLVVDYMLVIYAAKSMTAR
uniref:Uncharacterized protein n=1 Tax=Oryza sativa subsp. japonica TaxID=39947 RepID=Q6Z3F3_ORYSJ|nr:hypothetical protein [Oryza sativa Japonica Group]BAD33012.1 hypothetical protein [Oryza sativa Japonica Group]